MKKLLVLSLVLAMAGISSAAMVLSFGPVEGNTFSVNAVMQDIDAPDEAWLSLAGEITFDYASSAKGPAAGTATAWEISDGGYGPEWLYFANVAVPAPGSWVYDGTLFSVNLNYLAIADYAWVAGDVADATYKVFLYGSDGEAVVETLSYVVPEPMTMGLLGLGALFLRRRK